MTTLIQLTIAALCIALGGAVGYFVRKQWARQHVDSLEAKAQKIITDAKNKEQEIVLKAKERALTVIDEAKREETERRTELKDAQRRLESRETAFDKKLLELEDSKAHLQQKTEELETKKASVETLKAQVVTTLERVAHLSEEEASKELIVRVEEAHRDDLAARMLKLNRESSETFEREVKKILGTVIHRYAGSHSAETTTTTVSIPSEDMKGRIIGREGRNIKTIEKLTGCELVVDDTPGAITISGFSPIRRQIARIALEKLVADGRIQPARIEETIEEAKRELALDIQKAGEEALYELGITGIDPKLVGILGRLKYRTSYGQNNLLHSLEVGHLAGMIASELGEDPVIARKAGLFHDIGKAIDHETQGAHPQLGYALLKKFGFPEEIAYCCIAHHEDTPKTILGSIAKAADALSGARPGARKGTYEQYIARLEDLEKVATSFQGVEKAYAISAGREVRVFVRPQELDDFATYNLARDIAKKIEGELEYPGEIRVTVIRESRIVEYAK